jgi:hypothetical protein
MVWRLDAPRARSATRRARTLAAAPRAVGRNLRLEEGAVGSRGRRAGRRSGRGRAGTDRARARRSPRRPRSAGCDGPPRARRARRGRRSHRADVHAARVAQIDVAHEIEEAEERVVRHVQAFGTLAFANAARAQRWEGDGASIGTSGGRVLDRSSVGHRACAAEGALGCTTRPMKSPSAAESAKRNSTRPLPPPWTPS